MAESDWYGLFCVVQNIIQRGAPTMPARRIKELLGDPPQKPLERPMRRHITHDHVWDSTILGEPDSDFNPALEFYEKLLPAELPDRYSFILNYILPEAAISDIVESCDPRFTNQRVDFYCDRASLVIEIDGSQHSHGAQLYLDRERDRYLRRHGVDTIRIPARQPDAKRTAQELVGRIQELDGKDGFQDLEERFKANAFDVVLRTQIAILEMLKTGLIDIEDAAWKIDYRCDIPNQEHADLLRVAVDDLFDLVSNVCSLCGRSFAAPKILICSEAKSKIDVSASKMWDERDVRSQFVCVRSDYYESKNYYSVSCANPIRYQTLEEKRRSEVDASLTFFLKYLFGYETYRPGQMGVIRRALARNATLGILPTGSGKSLCYQMACLLQPCISFVVCPIISLIQDQEINTHDFHIDRVGRIDSQMDVASKDVVLSSMGEGRLHFVWISPERFQMKSFRVQLEEIDHRRSFGYAVIDEAHCLSEWGHDFRVSYLNLYSTIHRYCSSAVILALTATASKNVLDDLLAELHIEKSNVQVPLSLNRPELHYHIIETSKDSVAGSFDSVLDSINEYYSKAESLESIFEPHGDKSVCGIIFANTKQTPRGVSPLKGCEGMKSHLADREIVSDTYHADRREERTAIQRRYLDNEFTVMVATKAFGMGINKKNVRYTIHCGLPWSIEAFYQEAGRAGRDSDQDHNHSDCYVLYEPDDDPDRIRALRAVGTTAREIRAIQPKLKGDLNTLFFLWCGNHEDEEVETQAILEVFKVLNKGKDAQGMITIPDDLVRQLMFPIVVEKMMPGTKAELRIGTQDVLYKLAILGVVKDWTVDYRTHTLEVEVSEEVTEETVKASLEKYLKRHSPSFSFDMPSSRDEPYIREYEEAPIGKKFIGLVKLLLLWTNSNIVLNRRRAIVNMLDLCEAHYSDEELRRYIDNYFRLDAETNDQLDAIIADQDDFELWADLFVVHEPTDDPLVQLERFKTREEIDEVAALCDRYRESVNANIGLEWLALVSHLLVGKFNSAEVKEQYGFVIKEAGSHGPKKAHRLFELTVSILSNAPIGSRNAFGAAVVELTPDLALETHKKLEDVATLGFLVDELTGKLCDTWGRIVHHGE